MSCNRNGEWCLCRSHTHLFLHYVPSVRGQEHRVTYMFTSTYNTVMTSRVLTNRPGMYFWQWCCADKHKGHSFACAGTFHFIKKSSSHDFFFFFFFKKPSADNLLVYLTVNFRFPAVSTFTLHDLNAPYIGMNPSRGRLMICPSKISLNTKQSIVISQCWHFFTLLLNNMNHISNLHQLSFSLQWICLCVSQ